MPYELEDQVADLTSENEKLETEITSLEGDIEKQKDVIGKLTEILASGLTLQDRLMDEILHLHSHANERLPMDLIAAKDEFFKMVRKLLEEHRGN